MHALKMLHRKLKEAIGMHETRLRALVSGVGALIRGRRATVSGLGRCCGGSTYVRHRIKRMDRLLSNRQLHTAIPTIYRCLAHWLIPQGADVVIVVDWSDLTANQGWHVLRAGLPVKGRTLTILEEVHPQRDYGKDRVHRAFLAHLAGVLPTGVRPIIVTDAGFKTPWWQAVSSQGWRWLGRIRGKDLICREGSQNWLRWTVAAAQATGEPTDLGAYRVIRSRPTATRLVLYQNPPKRRGAKTVFGKQRIGRSSAKYARLQKEPWLLAAAPALADKSAAEIVSLYRARMQIEESFRDLKSAEFGLGMERHRTRKGPRLAVLLLLAALTLWLLWLIGQLATEPAIAAQLRPTARPSTLSRIRLALDWCATHAPRISATAMKEGWLDLTRYSASLANGYA